jgi:hypothetical protein
MASLATHYSIVVLDIESFSTRTNPIQQSLRSTMYEVVDDAVRGVFPEEHGIRREDRGDGILMLVPPTVSPVLLAGEFVRALDDGLKAKAAIFNEAHAMRFRVALHQGLAAPDPNGFSGDAVNFAFRLVDAQPLRDVLKASTKGRLAFIVSDGIYEDVIRHGYVTIDTAEYLPTTFAIKGGRRIRAWVRIPGYPAPLGLKDDPGEPGEPQEAPGPGETAKPPRAPEAAAPPPSGGVHNIKVKGDYVARDKHQTIYQQGSGK